jgi:hypothetical protein
MVNIRLEPCQKQKGSVDCGLFALAYAMSIVFGEDVSTREYNQGNIRSHLLSCFENCKLEPFP